MDTSPRRTFGIGLGVVAVLAVSLLAHHLDRAQSAARPVLRLQPLGAVPAAWLTDLAADLSLEWQVEPGPAAALPDDAYSATRRQVDADRVLHGLPTPERGAVLAVVAADGYAGDFNFVFGLSDCPGRRATLYLPRLAARADDGLRRRRLYTVARHELGHLAGLDHCAAPRCGLRFSATVEDVDHKGPSFCASCRRRWADWLRRVR